MFNTDLFTPTYGLVWGDKNCGRHFWGGGFGRFPEVLDAGEATSLVPFWDLKWDLETWNFCFFYVSFYGFLLFPSISHQNPFVSLMEMEKNPNNSHQIPLVTINNPSKLFCSHQVSIKFLLFPSSSQKVLIKFLLFPSITHQYPFVLIKFPKNSHQILLFPIKFPSQSFRSYQNAFVPTTMEDRQMSTKVNQWDLWQTRAEC